MRSDYARFQRDGWQRVAGKYEDAWAGLTRLFIPALLDAAHAGAGQRVLDVACGAGYVAEAACDRGASATGIDISSEMIRIARERNPDIEFRVGDALALDFDPAQFDAVVSNFGVIHTPDYAAAFAEARRVLRPSGVLAFTVWAGPGGSAGGRLMDGAVRAHADMNVPIPQGPDSLILARPDACRTMLTAAGFDAASVTFQTVTQGWRVPTASYIFELERDAGVRTAALLAHQTAETLDAIQRDVEAGMRAFADAPGFLVPYTAHIVSAQACPSSLHSSF
jgi:SAM-dependent methyltransferase